MIDLQKELYLRKLQAINHERDVCQRDIDKSNVAVDSLLKAGVISKEEHTRITNNLKMMSYEKLITRIDEVREWDLC